MSAAFDTLEATHRLENAGMDRKHAEAVATVVRDGQGQLATTTDIGELRTDMTARIDKLDDRLRIFQWIIGIVAATSVATLAVMLAHAS